MLKQPVHSNELTQTVAATADFKISSRNPFPGLRPFSADEHYLYFGRDGQINEILQKIATNRFVTVMGYSGSGKSSLMFCGFVPALHGGFMVESGPNWNVVLSRPNRSPIASLAESIVKSMIISDLADHQDFEFHKAVIASILRSSSFGLVEVAKYLQVEKTENVFFLIDQFEEIFRYRDEVGTSLQEMENEAQLYVKLILTAIKQTEVPVYVALTMRSDFIGGCSLFQGLTEEINKSNYLVPQMTRDEKRAAIEGPVAVAGGRITERLVKKLLNDMGKNQDQLPVLQHALMRTWDYWVTNHEPGEPIDLRHYQAIGKITQALSLHANELYDELPPRGKEIAEILFKNVTEKNQDNKGLRRPCRLGLIAELAEASEDEVIEVIDHFRQPGRSFLMPAAHIKLHSDSIIELSHESLMRIWNRLAGWVEDEFESASMYKRLSEAAAMYQIGKTGLWRPPDLQLALNWQKKQKPTREWAQRYDEAFERAIVFLDTSRITYEAELKNQEMMQRRVLRRTRATAIILGVISLVAILFFVLAYIQKLEADKDKMAAEQSRIEADQQRIIANKQRLEAERLRTVSEKRAQDLEVAKETVEDLNQFALRQLKISKEALSKAKLQEDLARAAGQQEMAAKFEAEINAEIAERNLQIATRLFMLTKAQELASKAAVQDDDAQLAGLLAMQGYLYHSKYQGKKYDRYIYEGLYSATTKLAGSSYNAMKIVGPPRIHMRSLAVSPKKNIFYISGADGRIYEANFEKLNNTRTGFETAYPSKVIALSRDEKFLVNGSDSSVVHVYNLQDPAQKRVINTLSNGTNDIEFLPDNSGFIIASQNKTLSIVDLKTMVLKPFVTLSSEIKAISIRPDGQMLAAASWNGQVFLVDMKDKSIKVLAEETSSRILSVKYSASGNMLAYGFEDGRGRGLVKLIEFNKQSVRQFSGHRAGVYDVEFSPDEKLLASAGSDKRLQLYVLESLEDLPVVMDNNNGFIWDIEFTKGSDYLIAACSESEIRVWPTDPALLANEICPMLKRNMNNDEWLKYVGTDIDYETTCEQVNK